MRSLSVGIAAPELLATGLLGLRAWGVQILFQARSLDDLPSFLRSFQPGVLILSLYLGSKEEVFHLLMRPRALPPVLLLVSRTEASEALDLLRLGLGIRGIALIEDSLEVLIQGLRTIVQGQTEWFSRKFLIQVNHKPQEPIWQNFLTPREREILVLLAQGMSNQEIARRLIISERTVRFHLRNIYEKLGCSGRGEAIALVNRALGRTWAGGFAVSTDRIGGLGE